MNKRIKQISNDQDVNTEIQDIDNSQYNYWPC